MRGNVINKKKNKTFVELDKGTQEINVRQEKWTFKDLENEI